MFEKILYALSGSVKSFSFIRGASFSKFSANLLLLFSVNGLIQGLFLIVDVFRSKTVNFGKGLDMSVMKLPEEHLFWVFCVGRQVQYHPCRVEHLVLSEEQVALLSRHQAPFKLMSWL